MNWKEEERERMKDKWTEQRERKKNGGIFRISAWAVFENYVGKFKEKVMY
jgi:hypothetical protein